MYRYLILLLLFPGFHASAQLVQGRVTDAGNGMPLIAVSVINMRTQNAATTNEYGLYSIEGVEGDKIVFTYVGYKTTERIKPPTVTIANINVALEPSSTQLKELIIKSDRRTQYQIDSAERKVIYRTPLNRRPPSPFNSPVSAIAELFNKKARMAYEFQQTFANDEMNRFIDTRYTKEMVKKLTGISDDSLGFFMYEYPMPYEFARNASDLEIKMWVRDSYKAWVKGGRITPFDSANTVKQH